MRREDWDPLVIKENKACKVFKAPRVKMDPLDLQDQQEVQDLKASMDRQ